MQHMCAVRWPQNSHLPTFVATVVTARTRSETTRSALYGQGKDSVGEEAAQHNDEQNDEVTARASLYMHVPMHSLENLIVGVAQLAQQVQLALCNAAAGSMLQLHGQFRHNQLQNKRCECRCWRLVKQVLAWFIGFVEGYGSL
jgi:hypothetical protein